MKKVGRTLNMQQALAAFLASPPGEGILFIIAAIIVGIIGNRSDVAFLRMWMAARSRAIAIPSR